MTNEKIRVLVAKAHDELAMLDLDGPTTAEGTAWGSCLREAKQALAEAVETLTVPDGDVRELLAEIIEPFIDTAMGDYGSGSYDGTLPDTILAALPLRLRDRPHIPYPGEPYDPAHRHDWADGACQSPDCMARTDGTTQGLSRAAAPEAVAKVRELHRPVEIEPSSTICHECSHQLPSGDYAEKVTEWPCATLDALGPTPEPEWETLPVGGETGGE